MGPRILELSKGMHTLTLRKRESDTRLDALYITDNLSLRTDQIQRRFEITMGYIKAPEPLESEPSAVEAKGKAITTWAEIKDN